MEHFRRLLHSKPTFETLTMMPQNAFEFLKNKQPIQAALALEYPSNLVPLCKVNNFYDVYPEEEFVDVDKLRDVVLYELINLRKELPDGREVACVRIRGAAFQDKKALKNFIKQLEQALKNDPVRRAFELELIEILDDDLLWLPRGMIFRELVVALWKKECDARGYNLFSARVVRSGVEALQARYARELMPLPYYFATQENRETEQNPDGLFQTACESSFEHFVFINESQLQKELISSLQFMAEMASILKLDAHFVLLQKGSSAQDTLVMGLSTLGVPFETKSSNQAGVTLEVRDGRGRAWPISQLYLDRKKGLIIEIQLILSLERVLGLLLERNEGYLPVHLAPEQARILPVDKESLDWAREVYDLLKERGVRVFLDEKEASLQAKMFEASKMRVPYALVLGRKEAANKMISVRHLREDQNSEEMTLDAFLLIMSQDLGIWA
jgi:threonyl-tRNA synthetase